MNRRLLTYAAGVLLFGGGVLAGGLPALGASARHAPLDMTSPSGGGGGHNNNPPELTVSDMTVPATGPDGAVVSKYSYVATDPDGDLDAVVCKPPEGSTFPVGMTPV